MSFEIHLTKRLGDTEIALGLSAGEGATVLFGPSGVGKTSILNMVAGLLAPDAGRIAVDGETLTNVASGVNIAPEQRRAGYVFQEPRLFPHLRVRANLLYAMRQKKSVRPEPVEGLLFFQRLRERAVLRQAQDKREGYGETEGSSPQSFDTIVTLLGIAHLLDRWPRTLSGGEARRVAIGRALLSNPRFLLLDEPLSSLDRPRREGIMQAIEAIRDDLKLPILMVTHDPEEAERIGTRVVRM